MIKNEKIAYDKLGEMIREKGNPQHIKEFSKFEGYPYNVSKESFLKTVFSFRKLQGKYGLTGDAKNTVKVFRKSPVFHLSVLYPMLTAIKNNKNLFDAIFTYNVNDDTEYKLPVFYICGKDDWQTPSIIVEEYFAKIQAPKKGLYWVENAGHLALLDNPKGFNDALLKVVEELQANR
jgi:pimeloyl-ACP methyl ester carboxylesterase